MMHMLGYTYASAGGVTNQAMTALGDNWAAISPSGNFLLPQDMIVRFAYANGANLTKARIDTPYLRQISLPYIDPIDVGANPTTLPAISWYDNMRLTLKATDETAVEVTDSAGATQEFALLGLTTDLNVNVPQGPATRAYFTAAITNGNKAWGLGAFTWDQVLPNGTYAVVGMDIVGANLVASRLVFSAGTFRPGVIARTAVGNKPERRFLGGNLGVFGIFQTPYQPQLELLGTAAPTTQTGYLDLVKMA